MNCEQARDLIDAYIDGELDLAHGAELDRHARSCTTCHRERDARLALREALRSDALRFSAPPSLARRVSRSGVPQLPWRILGPVMGLAAAAVVALVMVPQLLAPRDERSLARELTSAHVRSLQADHLFDVASSDRHTVKPWFGGKLDFAPPVQDWSAQGFELVGGRMDYIGGRAVAALVYRHQKHMINVFVWPESGADESSWIEVIDGFNVVRWRRGGMACRAVSDLSADELAKLAELTSAGP